jgi:hypothetical protein
MTREVPNRHQLSQTQLYVFDLGEFWHMADKYLE